MTDPFEHFDGAYVLGALDPEETRAFEEHMTSCPDCAGRVAEIADLPPLLDGVTVEEVQAPDVPLPDTLLPRLLREVQAGRRRRRITAGALAAVAACAAAVVIGVAVSGGGTPAPPGQALRQLVPTPVHATATLADRMWGTEITLHCRYDAVYGSGQGRYAMTATDTAGHVHRLGSWHIGPGQSLTFVGGTSVPRYRIAEIEVTQPGGRPILRLRT